MYSIAKRNVTSTVLWSIKCQIQMGEAQYENVATPLSTRGIDTTLQHFQVEISKKLWWNIAFLWKSKAEFRISNTLKEVMGRPSMKLDGREGGNQSKGPSTKDIRFLGPFFDLPTYPYPILAHCYDFFSIGISDFWKPTHLPKDGISFVDAPLFWLKNQKMS